MISDHKAPPTAKITGTMKIFLMALQSRPTSSESHFCSYKDESLLFVKWVCHCKSSHLKEQSAVVEKEIQLKEAFYFFKCLINTIKAVKQY